MKKNRFKKYGKMLKNLKIIGQNYQVQIEVINMNKRSKYEYK